jgi:hypothetical protein
MRAHDHDVDLELVPGAKPSQKQPHDEAAHTFEALRSGTPDAVKPTGVLSLQRAAGNASVSELMEEESPVKDVVGKGGGQPLDPGTRSAMESGIGADFSDVRVHTDAKASESAKSVGAHAYTSGSDVVFAQGKYSPETTEGQRTLAHELTHVVQQRSGPVDGTPQPSGISVSDPSDRFEQAAEANADRVVQSVSTAGVQREADHDHDQDADDVQGLFVQREASEEDEMEDEATPVSGMWVQREEEDEMESEE